MTQSTRIKSNNGLIEHLAQLQLHQGSYTTEVCYRLMTYGIPVDAIPVTSLGIVKTKVFGRWIQRRRYKNQYLAEAQARFVQENHATTTITDGKQEEGYGASFLFLTDKIYLPTNRDVLLGTGKILMKHPGNQTFRRL
jgi:hypothetical protein